MQLTVVFPVEYARIPLKAVALKGEALREERSAVAPTRETVAIAKADN